MLTPLLLLLLCKSQGLRYELGVIDREAAEKLREGLYEFGRNVVPASRGHIQCGP